MATKKLTAGVLALTILGTTAFAIPQTPVATDNAQGLPTIASHQQDLLAIASAGAFSSESAGVQLLSDAEMQEVRGSGWFSKWFKGNKWCIGSFIICK